MIGMTRALIFVMCPTSVNSKRPYLPESAHLLYRGVALQLHRRRRRLRRRRAPPPLILRRDDLFRPFQREVLSALQSGA